jgi:predicted nucleic acid-binding protein
LPSIAADAGPLIALFDGSDHHHVAAVQFVADLRQPLTTNLVVVGEVVALLPTRFQLQFLDWAIGALEIDQQTAADLPRIVEFMRKYADLPADFADASLVAMCERRSIASVATLDQHFDVYRTADRKRLRNVFSSG